MATQVYEPEEKDCGVAKFANLFYGKDHNNNNFDVYFPKNIKGPLPTIFAIHGGGYISGYKEQLSRYSQMMAKNGYVVVNVEYTRADGEEKKYFIDQIKELYSMFRFVKKSKLLSKMIDYNNVFLAGDSAGAHYASFIANLQNRSELKREFKLSGGPKIKGLIFQSPSFGIYRFGGFPLKNEYEHVIFGPKATRSPLCDKTHCIDLLDKDFPPCIMFSASNDFVVGVHKKLFLNKAKQLDLTVKHFNITSGYKLFHDSVINNPSKYEKTMENIREFVDSCVNGTIKKGFENNKLSEITKKTKIKTQPKPEVCCDMEITENTEASE